MKSDTAVIARSQMSLVLGRKDNRRNTSNIKITDLQTPKTRLYLMKAEEDSNVISCCHRYMIRTSTLQQIVVSTIGKQQYLNYVMYTYIIEDNVAAC